MSGALQPVLGDLESLGIGKETTYGTFATPTVFHAFTDFAPKPTNVSVPRTGARKHWGQARPVTAGFEAAATLDVEFDPDTAAQLLAFCLGTQSAPAALSGITFTLAAATIVGATSFTFTTTSALVYDCLPLVPGMVLTIDTAANQETLTIQSVVPSSSTTVAITVTTTAGATKAHAQGITANVASATAFQSTFTMGYLPSFSIELNRVTDAVRYLGCMVESVTIAMSPKTGLSTKFNIVYQTELVVSPASMTTPVYSTKSPLIFEHPYNVAMFNGAVIGQVGQVSLLQWSFTINNNLMKAFHSFGSGRLVPTFPQQQRKITGAATLGFESNAAYLAFLGATTGPAAIAVPAVGFAAGCVGSDIIDATNGVPYTLRIATANCTLLTHEVQNKSSSMTQQMFSFEAAESTSGANDDIKMWYTGSASSAF